MKKTEGLYFAASWMDYLNKDLELKKRTGVKGPSHSLEGRELIALDLEGLPQPYVLGLKNGMFYLEEKEAKNPLARIKISLDAFLKMATSVDERIIWVLLSNETQFSVVEGASWSDIITVLETLVALQELLDKQPELIKAA